MNTTEIETYPEAMRADSAETARLVGRARQASAEVEQIEAALEEALERRNTLFVECAKAGLSAQRISEALGGKPVASGVRYGIMRARQG